jgi:hypothetical protein
MSYADVVLADNPTGFWPLDEDTGTTANDISGNGFDGTYVDFGPLGTSSWRNNLTSVWVGDAGLSLSDNRVEIPASATLSSHAGANGLWSFDGWFKDTTGTNQQMVVTCAEFVSFPGEYEFLVYATGDNIVAEAANDTNSALVTTATAVDARPVGKWYHLAYTYDRAAAEARLYINGAEVASDTTMSGVTTYTGEVWRLGARGDFAWGDIWDGSMSHVAMYDTALTPEQVRTHAGTRRNRRSLGLRR